MKSWGQSWGRAWDSSVWADGGTLPVVRSPVTSVPPHPGVSCEAPYSSNVRLHIVVTMKDRLEYVWLRYLGMIGLTNAEVFVYLRSDPGERTAARIQLPCGMRFHEKLLLPNVGEEGAALLTHVSAHYDDLPDAIALLHGGSLHTWHASCGVAIRRLRAFYRGLSADASPTYKAFASDVVTLNSITRKGRWSVNDCCGPLMAKVHIEVDYPECPWQRVGTASILWEGLYRQALCRLRDATPQTNWTLLSTDIPEFFIDPRRVLQKYEDDPEQAVPLTHTRGQVFSPEMMARRGRPSAVASSDAQSAAAVVSISSLPAGVDGGRAHEPAASTTAPAAAAAGGGIPLPTEAGAAGGSSSEQWSGLLQGSRRVLGLGGADGGGGEALENVRDVVFPKHRESDLRPPQMNEVYKNHEIYGIERLWVWLLKVHGMYDNFTRPAGEGEVLCKWCCLQVAVPRHVIQRATKDWWLDAAFLMTNLGWKPRPEWPSQLGFLMEWRLWPSLDHAYATKAAMQRYLDVEIEMGPDSVIARCAAELAVPLVELNTTNVGG